MGQIRARMKNRMASRTKNSTMGASSNVDGTSLWMERGFLYPGARLRERSLDIFSPYNKWAFVCPYYTRG